MGPYNFETNVFGNFDHDESHTELCLENYFPEKNLSTLSKQPKNILIKFSILKGLEQLRSN